MGVLASVLDVQSIFYLLKKIKFALWSDIMLYIIGKKSSFSIWRQTVKPSFDHHQCIVCGLNRPIERMVNVSFFILVWFLSFKWTVRLLKVKQVYENKTDWLQNEHYKNFFLRIRFLIFLDNCTQKYVKPQKRRYWGFSSTLTPARLFTIWGRRKRGF